MIRVRLYVDEEVLFDATEAQLRFLHHVGEYPLAEAALTLMAEARRPFGPRGTGAPPAL